MAIIQSDTQLVYGNTKKEKQYSYFVWIILGIKHYNEEDLNHLLNALHTKYEIATDRLGTNYIGLTIAWQYEQGHVEISMPDYVLKALQKFQHNPPSQQQ